MRGRLGMKTQGRKGDGKREGRKEPQWERKPIFPPDNSPSLLGNHGRVNTPSRYDQLANSFIRILNRVKLEQGN